MRTKYIPEILKEFESKSKKADKVAIVETFRRMPALISLIRLAYGNQTPVLTKSDIKKLLEEDYEKPSEEYELNASHLFVEYRKVNLFFNHTPALKKERLESLFVQMREILHEDEFEVVVKVLKKQNLAKGLTENLLREVFPKLLPAVEKDG